MDSGERRVRVAGDPSECGSAAGGNAPQAGALRSGRPRGTKASMRASLPSDARCRGRRLHCATIGAERHPRVRGRSRTAVAWAGVVLVTESGRRYAATMCLAVLGATSRRPRTCLRLPVPSGGSAAECPSNHSVQAAAGHRHGCNAHPKERERCRSRNAEAYTSVAIGRKAGFRESVQAIR
ncbi:MAG: hypothetical protein D6725_12280 [Planctomycetota bacterium]|nr:MAG: hypothetical protein D6725_12280 [Planctomycetota bacterium]